MPEPRGPDVFFAGLCCTCGRATTERDDDGLPRHRLRDRPNDTPQLLGDD